MTNYLAKATKWLGYSIAFLIVLAATLVSVGRLLTPYLNEHLPDFEVWASQLLNTPVKIENVHISWNVYVPYLTFENVIIIDEHTRKHTFEIQQIKINFKLLDSLLNRKPIPSYINISGVDVIIRASKSGKVLVAGLGPFSVSDHLTGAAEEGSTVAYWIFSQPALVLDNIHVKFILEKGETQSITVYKLSLFNTKSSHTLKAKAALNQDIPTSITFNLEWIGDLRDPANISAHLYAYLQAVSLPQWAKKESWQQLQILEGLASAKIWADWGQGQFQKIQTEFQMYELKLHSLITNKTQLITRLNGNLGWRKEGSQQIFAGNDILIDLPEHLWPITSFYVALPLFESVKVPDNTSAYEFNQNLHLSPQKEMGLTEAMTKTMENHAKAPGKYVVQVDYLDLADSNEFLVASGILPEKLQKFLLELSPKGELYDLNVNLNDVNHLENNAFSAKFFDLSFNAYQAFPAIKNLTGAMQWDKNNGNLSIHAKNSEFMQRTFFANPLRFEQLEGKFKLQKNAEGTWLLNAKKWHAENEDLKILSDFTVAIPENDSPKVDFKADFSITNAVHLATYMPVKKLDPDLAEWLNQAFLSGQFVSGKAIVQGRMSDFPFAKGDGKFIFSVESKDLTFSYAPDWPLIKHLNGSLIFSGEKMEVLIANGQLLNIPLFNIAAEIPYIGPKQPQILSVNGKINGEMAEGLQFIHQSPLQKTIGKDLDVLQISGPMQLNLALTIPVKRPKNSQVKGDIAFSNNQLQMQDWGILLDRLQGVLHFTEDSIEATTIQGNLFNEPVTIGIVTEHPVKLPSVVKIGLQSKITSELLHTWLKGTLLGKYINGGTSYTAEVRLISSEHQQPIQVIVKSDLQGIALDFPDFLSKKPNESLDSILLAHIQENQPIQLKLKLDKKLSVATTIKKTTKGLDLYSGELRIGDQGEANWQKAPGFLVSGQFDTLNWEVLKKYLPESTTAQSEKPFIDLLQSLDIRAKKISGFAQPITKARIQATQSATNWTVNLNTAEMAGQIILPKSFASRETVRANFQYIYLAPTTQSNELINPKNLPGIAFFGNDVRYKGKNLGRIQFEFAPIENGLKLNSFSTDSALYNLSATGDWLFINNKVQTSLKGKLTTQDVAKFLNYWGSSSPNPVGSQGSMLFDLGWPEAPYNPVLAKMFGEAKLDISGGQIINLDQSTNAKMGFGRMLNILSLQSLSHVLTLNFKDLTAKGYNFDFMRGGFSLKNGSIFTEDARIDGSLANIEMKGRIGLIAKDYNLTLNITPLVTGSIPVVAAAIAVNPLIGVAAWAVEKVASSAVSSATAKRYSITGTWDKPIWREGK